MGEVYTSVPVRENKGEKVLNFINLWLVDCLWSWGWNGFKMGEIKVYISLLNPESASCFWRIGKVKMYNEGQKL